MLSLFICRLISFYIFVSYLAEQYESKYSIPTQSTAFLFSLINNENLEPFKMKIRSDMIHQAATKDSENGPIFGVTDLFIASSNSYSHNTGLGQSYELPTGFSQGTLRTRTLLSGYEYFTPDTLEVFCFKRMFFFFSILFRFVTI